MVIMRILSKLCHTKLMVLYIFPVIPISILTIKIIRHNGKYSLSDGLMVNDIPVRMANIILM